MSEPGRNICVGDLVSIEYVDGDDAFGIVENTPGDTGDMWYILGRTWHGALVTRFAFNPSCSDLRRISLVTGDKAEECKKKIREEWKVEDDKLLF